jgi:NAD-dependent dihydropyrimidine dehydrogenase PreA subunit
VGKLLPSINPDVCAGCDECVEACPLDCLEVVEGVATLQSPKACRGEGLCVSACPRRAIRLEWRAARRRGIARFAR